MGSRPLPHLLKGLSALAALAALEAGVPLALLAWGTNPHQIPTWQQTTDALTGPDNGSLFLGALTVIGWLAWTLFTIQVLLELIAVLRHRAAPRLPVLGAGQHLAATLVAAVVLLLPTTGTALAQGAPPTAAAATLHLPHHTAPSPQQVAMAVGAQATADSTGPVHHVSAGDETLWGLAEHYLGDGTRWKDIAALNQGIVQTDGQTLTPTTLHLVPGWTLRLPADAHAHPPRHTAQHTHDVHQEQRPDGDEGADGRGNGPRPVTAGERVHIVRPGETLSQIAQDDLGTAGAYPAIYTASTGITQPGGQHLTDPNLILPGWKLDVPQPAAAPTPGLPGGAAHAGGGRDGGHSPTAAPTPTAPTGSPTASPSTSPTSTPGTGPVGAPTASATALPSQAPATPAAPGTPTATAAPSTPSLVTSSPAPAAPTVASATADDSQAGSELRIGVAIAALLAAGLLGGYGVKRALQQRSRRPGETIAVPVETSSLEQILANQADPATAELLDLALRTMASRLPEGEPLPQLEAARIERTRIQLRADGPAITPFTRGEDGWWNLDPAAQLLDPAAASDVAAPYPMLATLGKEPDGTLVLVDMAAARTLLLDGTTEQVREVARGLALDAATSPWGQELQVLSAGLIEAALPQMMATGRIRRLDRIGHAVTDLADQLLTAHQDPDASVPWMLVASDHIDEETAWELAGLVSRSPNAPVALALPGEGLDALFPDAMRLNCATTEPQQLQHITAPVHLQRVTEAEYQILNQDLRTTEQPANEATGAWTRVPDDTRTLAQPPTRQPVTDEAATGAADPTETDGESGGVVTPFLALTGQSGHSPTRTAPVPVLLTPAPSGPSALPAPVPPAAEGAEDAQALPVDVPAQSALAAEPADLHAPEIRLLGPVDVTGLGNSGRGRRLAEVAAYLYLRPGRTRHDLAEAMSPGIPWTEKSVKQRLHDLRNLLGNTPDGTPRLARNARDGILPTMTGVRCDWTRFCKLAERGLLAGPQGVDDLEAALALVRGRPFAGSTAAWSMPDAQEMISRIVDTAHTVARYRTDTGHYTQARAAIARGIDVEPTAEMLYRDWLALEAACGNIAEVHRIISRLQEELRALDVEMDHTTEQLIQEIFQRHMKLDFVAGRDLGVGGSTRRLLPRRG